ncbi:hypothetical protein BC828DRAFT_382753 [Blastocladiella britannica]|nr:hypothetical protein BC828DRAFT_382753 [Blastocladiella britannica]
MLVLGRTLARNWPIGYANMIAMYAVMAKGLPRIEKRVLMNERTQLKMRPRTITRNVSDGVEGSSERGTSSCTICSKSLSITKDDSSLFSPRAVGFSFSVIVGCYAAV